MSFGILEKRSNKNQRSVKTIRTQKIKPKRLQKWDGGRVQKLVERIEKSQKLLTILKESGFL
jgi:hypothetical protein